MDADRIAELKSAIEDLEAQQRQLFAIGWDHNRLWVPMLQMLLVFGGLSGIASVLYKGLSWFSAALIFGGGFALYRGLEHDRTVGHCRSTWQKNRARLDEMKIEYQDLTAVPDTPEESEKKWRALMEECDQLAAEAATKHP